MTSKELSERLQPLVGRKQADALAHELVISEFPVKDLIALCFHKDFKTGFHAAWVLEQLCTGTFDYFIPAFPFFVTRFAETSNPSVKRHFGKILWLTLKNFQKKHYEKQARQFWNEPHERLIQTLFEWLIDSKVRPGVKVWCMDVLEMLAPHYPWIYDELAPTVQTLLGHASPGLLSRGRKLLQRS